MYRKTDEQTRRDPFQDVTNRILEALEAGVKPWVKPWNPDQAGGPQGPFNPTTGRYYRGINVLILGMDMRAFTSGDPRWMTYQQAKEKGWQVTKGEKATAIFFYKPLEVDDPEAKDGTRTIPVLKTYSVFHASQVAGIPAYQAPSVEEAPWQRPEAADLILQNSGADIRTGGGRAFYSPGTDHIQLPPEAAFRGPHEWAAVALHELGHWTGHAKRLARDLSGRFGSYAYAQEELRAELASAFIGTTLGLPTDIPQHASYIGMVALLSLGSGFCFAAMESRHPYAERHLAKAGVARCKGRGLRTLGEEAKPERKGRSGAEVCTSAARKIGDTPCGARLGLAPERT
jgi:antirestriction protein ArdC